MTDAPKFTREELTNFVVYAARCGYASQPQGDLAAFALTLLDENEWLRKVAGYGLTCFDEARSELADLDGGWLQDRAEELGLLREVHVTEPCGEHCRCAEWDSFPQECLRETEVVRAVRRALEWKGEG